MRSIDSYGYPETIEVKLKAGDVFTLVPLIDLLAPRLPFPLSSESLKDLVAMEVDAPADVKNELPTPPASDVGSPTSFSHCGSDSEPDSPMGEDTKVRMVKK